MENFLIPLLIVGAAGYRIYSEYRKEQEKARKRIPQAQGIPQVQVSPIQEPHPIKKNLDLEEVEVVLPQPKINKVEVIKPKEDFDLRKAVIQEAILNRKY